MSLVFDERQLLVPGIHEATLEIVKKHFARFQKTDKRLTLFGKLKEYAAAIQKAGWKCSLIIDGSFVMPAVDEPEDIDLILVLPEDWDMTEDLKPHLYNLVSKKRVKREYGIEVFSVPSGSRAELEWIDFFCQVNIKWCQSFNWPSDARKGIVKVAL